MGSEALVIGTIALVLGAGIGHILRNRIKKILNTKQKEMDAIVNDPDLLVEKLNKNGKMVDSGEELKYSVVEEGGVRKVSLEKTKVKPEQPLQPQTTKSKVVKKATKKGNPKK